MSNTMNFTGHHVNRLPAYTTTTTTTTSYGPGPSGYCNGSSAYNPANMNSGINLSSKGQMLMCLLSVMNQLTNGAFGDVMSSLGIGPQGQGQCQNQMNPYQNPGFGQTRGCGNGGQNMEQQWNEFNQFREMQHRQRLACLIAAQDRWRPTERIWPPSKLNRPTPPRLLRARPPK